MKKSKILMLIICCFVTTLFTGCIKPYKKELLVEIKPNETAFIVPLEGKSKSGQAEFMSLNYLEENKVATKRVNLPQRFQQTGRQHWYGKWIPTAKIITVNRVPVTREWTADSDRGTSTKNEAIEVESKDSIGFNVGVNITALIKEEDAARFLYNYAGVPLDNIIDLNIRGKVSSVLSREFGSRLLSKCKSDKKAISEVLLKEVKAEFAPMGITITNIGLVGGLTYENVEIQRAINAAYEAEMAVETARQQKEMQKEINAREVSKRVAAAEAERLRQDEINKMNIDKATAERKAAEEFEKARASIVAQTELEIKKMKAEAELTKAKRWSGNLPEKMLQGEKVSFLMQE